MTMSRRLIRGAVEGRARARAPPRFPGVRHGRMDGHTPAPQKKEDGRDHPCRAERGARAPSDREITAGYSRNGVEIGTWWTGHYC